MRQKFYLEIILVRIVSIISLKSFSGIHPVEVSACIDVINGDTTLAQLIQGECCYK